MPADRGQRPRHCRPGRAEPKCSAESKTHPCDRLLFSLLSLFLNPSLRGGVFVLGPFSWRLLLWRSFRHCDKVARSGVFTRTFLRARIFWRPRSSFERILPSVIHQSRVRTRGVLVGGWFVSDWALLVDRLRVKQLFGRVAVLAIRCSAHEWPSSLKGHLGTAVAPPFP
jgi:hypothetical protein